MKLQREPYFYLFNLGVAAASLGVLLWLAFYTGTLSSYPIRAHGSIMFFSFLFSFVIGFLMTAIPKMTRSSPASSNEILLALLLCAGHCFFYLVPAANFSVCIVALQLSFINIFIVRRVLQTKIIPFEGFVFLLFSFALAWFGVVWTLFFSGGDFKYFYMFCGEAFVLNAVCGIGVRLIPVISRAPAALPVDQLNRFPAYLEFVIYGFLLNLTYVLEFLGHTQLANGGRVIFLIYYTLVKFKIFQKPVQLSVAGIGLKAALLGLIAGYGLITFNIGGYLAGMHVVYISGFTLLTMMVASRVAIAHSQRSINMEIRSVPLILTIGLFLSSAILRYLMSWNSQMKTVVLAIVFFLTALWIWNIFILKSKRAEKQSGDQC